MRRECPACKETYWTEPVVGTGSLGHVRLVLITCSFPCLRDEINKQIELRG